MYGFSKDCLILVAFRLPHISCFTLSLKCFSSDSDNCPSVGIGPLLQFSHPMRGDPVLLTLLLFPPGSFILPSFVVIYILFLWSGTPVLSQLVFCMHFCLKVYSWCIRGERCTPHPPTPPPSCSSLKSIFYSIWNIFVIIWYNARI